MEEVFAALKPYNSLLLLELINANAAYSFSFHFSQVESLYLQIQLIEFESTVELTAQSKVGIVGTPSPNVGDLPTAKVHGEDNMCNDEGNHIEDKENPITVEESVLGIIRKTLYELKVPSDYRKQRVEKVENVNSEDPCLLLEESQSD